MNRIKELRTARGITQEHLGEILNVRKSTISRYEKGTMFPAPETLIAMANYFNVTIGYLLDHEDTPSPAKSTSTPASIATAIPALSPEALEVARIYDSVDRRGKQAIMSTAKNEASNSAEAFIEETTVS